MRKVSAITLLLLSSTSFAQDYQTFTRLSAYKTERSHSDVDGAWLSAQYFFKARTALGPLDQFEYINKISNVGGSVNDRPGKDYFYNLGGQAFIGNVLVGAGYSNNRFDRERESLQVGYLFNDDFLVNVSASKVGSDDTTYHLSSRYNIQINETDYLGVSISTDDNFEYKSISSTYFSKVGDNKYLTARVDYGDYDSYKHWILYSSFYFTEKTSVNASYGKGKSYSLGVKHFFNNNFAIGAGYYSNTNDSDYKSYSVNFSTQF